MLAIGGLKEKALAAFRAGIDTVIVPKQNEKDANKIPKTIKSKLKFVFATKVEEVLEHALIGVELNEY
ncbi:Lon protease 1 [compost metagenome]